jgi:hypothetical protein
MSIKDIIKSNGLKDINDILDKETNDRISKELISSTAKDYRFINEREDFANSYFFTYYEVRFINKQKIILEYGKLKIALPWQCNQDLKLFKIIVQELATFLKTNLKDSNLPKPDTD